MIDEYGFCVAALHSCAELLRNIEARKAQEQYWKLRDEQMRRSVDYVTASFQAKVAAAKAAAMIFPEGTDSRGRGE